MVLRKFAMLVSALSSRDALSQPAPVPQPSSPPPAMTPAPAATPTATPPANVTVNISFGANLSDPRLRAQWGLSDAFGVSTSQTGDNPVERITCKASGGGSCSNTFTPAALSQPASAQSLLLTLVGDVDTNSVFQDFSLTFTWSPFPDEANESVSLPFDGRTWDIVVDAWPNPMRECTCGCNTKDLHPKRICTTTAKPGTLPEDQTPGDLWELQDLHCPTYETFIPKPAGKTCEEVSSAAAPPLCRGWALDRAYGEYWWAEIHLDSVTKGQLAGCREVRRYPMMQIFRQILLRLLFPPSLLGPGPDTPGPDDGEGPSSGITDPFRL